MKKFRIYQWIVSIGWTLDSSERELAEAFARVRELEEVGTPAMVTAGTPPKKVYQTKEA